jgi:hypothetical protein
VFTWQEVECLGACVNAPDGLDQRLLLRGSTPESMGQLIDQFFPATVAEAGSYGGRHASEPAGGRGPRLLDQSLFDGSRASQDRDAAQQRPAAGARRMTPGYKQAKAKLGTLSGPEQEASCAACSSTSRRLTRAAQPWPWSPSGLGGRHPGVRRQRRS